MATSLSSSALESRRAPVSPSSTPLDSLDPLDSALDSTVPRRDTSHPLAPGNYYRLGKETGLARQHISRALRGQSGLSFEAAQRIAAAAGVSVDEVKEWIEEAHRRNGKAVKGKKVKIQGVSEG